MARKTVSDIVNKLYDELRELDPEEAEKEVEAWNDRNCPAYAFRLRTGLLNVIADLKD